MSAVIAVSRDDCVHFITSSCVLSISFISLSNSNGVCCRSAWFASNKAGKLPVAICSSIVKPHRCRLTAVNPSLVSIGITRVAGDTAGFFDMELSVPIIAFVRFLSKFLESESFATTSFGRFKSQSSNDGKCRSVCRKFGSAFFSIYSVSAVSPFITYGYGMGRRTISEMECVPMVSLLLTFDSFSFS